MPASSSRVTRHHNQLAWAWLLLPVLALLGLFAIPVWKILSDSFLDYKHNLYQPTWVGPLPYLQLLGEERFWQTLRQTLWLWLLTLLPMLGLSLALTWVYAELGGLARWIRPVLYFPVLVSVIVAALLFKALFTQDGLVNGVLQWLHLSPIPWLSDPFWAQILVVLLTLWKGVPYYAGLLVIQLQRLDPSLREASALDGAGAWQQFRWIVLPHLLPTVGFCALISTLGSFKLFTEPYVLTQGGPLHATETLVMGIYQKAFGELDLGLASAMCVTLAGLCLIPTVLQYRLQQQLEASEP
jgi:putative chitobiose transport system permease protein